MDPTQITTFCFGASYTVALILELVQLLWPRRIQRFVALGFGCAGLVAHTAYLILQHPPLSSQYGSLLLLAWILAVFYLYGTVHHRRVSWAVFVLPLVIGLVVLAVVLRPLGGPGPANSLDGERLWGLVHGGLLLLAAVGVCVAFLASVMYLVQAYRLRTKAAPTQGLRLMSLERLEEMNRRAINLAFPLFTAGVLVGAVLLLQRYEQIAGWTDLKVIATIVLWLAFPILLYLRYGYHLRGRNLAVLTIVAFALLVVTLTASHTLVPGEPR